MSPRSTIAWPSRVIECVCEGSRMNDGYLAGSGVAGSATLGRRKRRSPCSSGVGVPGPGIGLGGRDDPHRLQDLLEPGLDLLRVGAAELDVLRRLGDYVEVLVRDHNWESAVCGEPGAIPE